MSLARNVAFLNLLVASRPTLADIPVEIQVRPSGKVELSTRRSQSADVPDIAARLAKALRVTVETHSGDSEDGEKWICHQVEAKFHGVLISFWGYEYPDRQQPSAEPNAATVLPLAEAPGGAV